MESLNQIIKRGTRTLPEALADLRCNPADLWNFIDRDAQARSLLDADGLHQYEAWCRIKSHADAA